MSSELIEDLAKLSKDPYAFVLWAFPWGEPDTELSGTRGPEDWQRDVLFAVRDGLLNLNEAIQIAVASGHGVGKSALCSWLILWAISTFEDTRGVVTANTENQLKTKTWVELAKWHRLFIARELFEWSATRICSRDPAHADTWRVDMVPWSERTTEAFAGLHNKGKRIIVLFDEASAIPDVIHETTEGALTDEGTEIIWCKFGNPTRNTGKFREAFSKPELGWKTFKVDSRTVTITNKTQIEKWLRAYGEDSDFFRVRVRGEFPRIGATEFISRVVAEAAAVRSIETHPYDPLVLGVDVARFGDDESVIAVRRGRDARSIPWQYYRGLDTVALAARVSELFRALSADAVFVDGGGVGGGVVDNLRVLRVPVFEIQFGAAADRADPATDGEVYANKRAEMYGSLRAWLAGGMIPEDNELIDQMSGILYAFNGKDAIQLEKKSDMKKRGVASPDRADALALTFAYPVAPAALLRGLGQPSTIESEYNPFDPKYMAV